jgi:S-adenosylmethionine/arginine decarboxylase-like enzyme
MFKLGFVDDENLNDETTINFLMQKALEKVNADVVNYTHQKFGSL